MSTFVLVLLVLALLLVLGLYSGPWRTALNVSLVIFVVVLLLIILSHWLPSPTENEPATSLPSTLQQQEQALVKLFGPTWKHLDNHLTVNLAAHPPGQLVHTNFSVLGLDKGSGTAERAQMKFTWKGQVSGPALPVRFCTAHEQAMQPISSISSPYNLPGFGRTHLILKREPGAASALQLTASLVRIAGPEVVWVRMMSQNLDTQPTLAADNLYRLLESLPQGQRWQLFILPRDKTGQPLAPAYLWEKLEVPGKGLRTRVFVEIAGQYFDYGPATSHNSILVLDSSLVPPGPGSVNLGLLTDASLLVTLVTHP
jgi:hypothetical protein